MYNYRRNYKSLKDKKPPTASVVSNILQSHLIIDPNDVILSFISNPAAFDFQKMTPMQINSVLAYDFALFAPHVDINSIAVYEKIRWLKYRSEDAIKYINLDKMPNYAIDELITDRPDLVSKYNMPVNKLLIGGWQSLINHNNKYLSNLVSNLHSLRNKSELRGLIVENTDIFPLLTIESMQQSVISAKEWALLLKWPSLKNKVVKYSPEVTEWLDQEILTEILLGNSKSSKQLNAALEVLRR